MQNLTEEATFVDRVVRFLRLQPLMFWRNHANDDLLKEGNKRLGGTKDRPTTERPEIADRQKGGRG